MNPSPSNTPTLLQKGPDGRLFRLSTAISVLGCSRNKVICVFLKSHMLLSTVNPHYTLQTHTHKERERDGGGGGGRGISTSSKEREKK